MCVITFFLLSELCVRWSWRKAGGILKARSAVQNKHATGLFGLGNIGPVDTRCNCSRKECCAVTEIPSEPTLIPDKMTTLNQTPFFHSVFRLPFRGPA